MTVKRWWLSLAILVLVAAGCGASGTSTSPVTGGNAIGVAVRGAGSTFLTLEHLGNGPSVELQLRRLGDGRVIADLQQSEFFGGAVETSPASALVDISDGCNGKLERINLLNGHVSVVRRFQQPVDGFAVNPSATEFAYATVANCSPPLKCPGTCDTPSGHGPTTIVVLNLRTGRVSETTLTGPTHSTLGRLAWSPDGRNIAVTVENGGPSQVAIVDAAHPDLRAAQLLPTPAGCDESDVAWTALGILTEETCGDGTPSLIDRFVALATTDQTVRRWPVPACTYGIAAEPIAGTNEIVVSTDVGYGTCSPENTWTARFWTIADTKLKPLFAVPGAGFNVELST